MTYKRLGRSARRGFTSIFRQEQGDLCAMCGKPESEVGLLELDHDHETGLPRGLLCGPCNRALGKYEVHEDQIKLYLNRRIDRTELYLRTAYLFAKRSTCPRKQVGAVIVKDARIIAHGYNGAPAGLPHCNDVGCIIGPDGGCLRVSHAEANAISHAAKRGIAPLEGAITYLTLSPCLTCSRLLITAGISKVVFHKRYRDESGIDLLIQAGVKVRGIS